MPEANTVKFRYDPVDSTLYLDQSRIEFYMERLDGVRDRLFEMCEECNVTRQIEGEIEFTDDAETPPRVSELGYVGHWANPQKNPELPDEITLD